VLICHRRNRHGAAREGDGWCWRHC
jgi:hypothetical protein